MNYTNNASNNIGPNGFHNQNFDIDFLIVDTGILFILIILLIFGIVANWIYYKRNNQKGWKSIIPFYNLYILGQMSESEVLAIIAIFASIFSIFLVPPIVTIIMTIIMNYKIMKKFNKGFWYSFFFSLLPFFFIFSVKKFPTLPNNENGSDNNNWINASMNNNGTVDPNMSDTLNKQDNVTSTSNVITPNLISPNNSDASSSNLTPPSTDPDTSMNNPTNDYPTQTPPSINRS